MAQAPGPNDEQMEEKEAPVQNVTVDTSALQTPINEERGKKRDREEHTPLSTATSQQGEKRQRLDPFSEEEMTFGQTQMGPPSTEVSASSFQQEHQRILGGEVSSSGQQRKGESSIKKQFIDIKTRNEPLRLHLYNHLLKMAPTN